MLYRKNLTILVIEDDELDAALLKKTLADSNLEIKVASKLSEGLEFISKGLDFDAILLDLTLPDSTGFDTVKTVQKAAPDIAIIIITGTDDEEIIANSLQVGVQDYLVKREVDSKTLKRSIRYAIERKRFELQLKEALDLNKQIFSATTLGVLTYKISGQCVFANEAAAQIINTTIDKLLEQNFHHIESWKESELYETVKQVISSGIPQRKEVHLFTTFKKEVWVEFYIATFMSTGEKHLLLILNDNTYKEHISRALEWKNYLMDILLQNTPESIYFKDLEGHILELSKTLSKKLGFEDSRYLIGKTDFDLFSEQHARQAHEDELKIITSGEGIYNFEEKETYPDKPDTWVITSKMPLKDENGKIIGTFGLSRDITDRKLAEEALVKSKAQLYEAMLVAQLYQWSYDINDSSFVYDEKLAYFLGFEGIEKGIYKMPITEFGEKFVHPDDKHILAEDRIKVRTATDPCFMSQVEYRIIRLDGCIRHIMVRTRIEMDERQKHIRYYGILQDITERKIAIQEAFEALNQIDNVKTEFLSLISQEIRVPLNGIVGAINLIKNQESSSAIKDLVETLDKSVSNLESFTENATLYSRLTNKIDLNLSSFSIKDLMQFAFLENENAIADKKIDIQFKPGPGNFILNADKDLIYKALVNLLQISIDISSKNSTISITILEDGEETICLITKNNESFPEELLNNFSSTSGLYTNRQMGLSLHIIKLIMNIHKGELQVYNNDNAMAVIKLVFTKS